MNNKPLKVLTDGIIANNPVLVGMLGMCPSLAVTVTLINGLGMGIATTFVLICSNITISLLKNIIPDQVRLPCYIVTIAGFVTFVSTIVQAYIPQLYNSLGMFLPLITVNCIVLGRAEVFASKNNPALSALDGIGMGIGFTLALAAMGAVREIMGLGTLLSGTKYVLEMPFLSDNPLSIFIMPAGGFFTFAILLTLINRLRRTPPREFGCANCPSKNICTKTKCENNAEENQVGKV